MQRSFRVRLVAVTVLVLALSGASVPSVAAAGPYWQQTGSHCFARWYAKNGAGQNTGWMDTCYRLHKLMSDGDSTYDHYTITAYATVDATREHWQGDYAWIHVNRSSGPTFLWEDWDPRTDKSGSCGNVTLSISGGGVGLSYGTSICETWSVTKGAAGGDLKVQWNGNSAGAREVALMSAIKVPNGASAPVWGISWYYKTFCGVSRYC